MWPRYVCEIVKVYVYKSNISFTLKLNHFKRSKTPNLKHPSSRLMSASFPNNEWYVASTNHTIKPLNKNRRWVVMKDKERLTIYSGNDAQIYSARPAATFSGKKRRRDENYVKNEPHKRSKLAMNYRRDVGGDDTSESSHAPRFTEIMREFLSNQKDINDSEYQHIMDRFEALTRDVMTDKLKAECFWAIDLLDLLGKEKWEKFVELVKCEMSGASRSTININTEPPELKYYGKVKRRGRSQYVISSSVRFNMYVNGRSEEVELEQQTVLKKKKINK